MRLAILICLLALASPAQTVLRSGTFRALNSTPGGGPPADGYEANVYAYYKFEETNGTAIDSAHARNLGNYAGGAATVPGILGNCFDFGTNFGFGNPGPLSLSSSPGDGGSNADYSLSTNSFTMRFWVKTVASGFNNIFWPGDSFGIGYGSAPSGVDGKIDFNLIQTNGEVHITSLQDIADGQWHRVIVWHDAQTFDAGLQIDSNSPTNRITTELYNPCPTFCPSIIRLGDPTDQFPNPPNPSFLMDDLVIWKDYVLTPGDRDFDWNGGAGRTYPLP